jgi:hypothetical protein
MPATGARAARTAGAAAGAAGACHGPTAGMGVEDRQHARSVLAVALLTRDRHIGVLHRTQDFEFLFAIQAKIFINRHQVTLFKPLKLQSINSNSHSNRGQVVWEKIRQFLQLQLDRSIVNFDFWIGSGMSKKFRRKIQA